MNAIIVRSHTILALGILSSFAMLPAQALPKITPVTAKCICGCEGSGSGTVPLVQFAAPGGDPNGCAGMNGTQCKAGGKGGTLTDCVGRVTDERVTGVSTGVSIGGAKSEMKQPMQAPSAPVGPKP